MGTSNLTLDATLAAAEPSTRLPAPPVLLRRPALFLDMDGVLAEIAPAPDDVGPVARRTEVLKRLQARLHGRVAIVSGRTVAEIDRIAEAAVASASGVHGLERRLAGGDLVRAPAAEAVRDVVEAFEDFARDKPGVLVEDKIVSAGLHFRAQPDAAREAEALARRLADQNALAVQPGSMVIEVKTPGSTKGTAIQAFMAEAPFKGSVPVMLGDDLTDEDGFKAATELGGFGVLVGPPRPTAARYGLPDVEAVLAWLTTVEEDA